MDEKLVYIRKTYCEYFQVLIGNISNIYINYRISEDDFNKKFKRWHKTYRWKKYSQNTFYWRKANTSIFYWKWYIYSFDIKNENDLRKLNDFQYKKEVTFKNEKKFSIFSKFGSDWDYLLSYNRKN